MGYRIGVDIGGTFTDIVCVTPNGEVIIDKALTTPQDRSLGVMTGLDQLAQRLGMSVQEFCKQIDVFAHGSTVADNTMIEMNGAVTGLLTTRGHRDEIELRRCFKEEIWDPAFPPPVPIARRRARIGISERIDASGHVVMPLSEEEVRAGVRRLRQLGVESIAVVFLFSYLNPSHELRARELIVEEFPEVLQISLSHEVNPRAPEYERTSTTLVNAYVGPRLESYLAHLSDKLREAGYGGQVLLMQSTGGVMLPDYVARNAVSLLGSGPTAGVLGATRAAQMAGVQDFVSVDMGGTSYDICLVRDAQPEISIDWNWRHRYYVALPMVNVQAIGAGGGSIASVQAGSLSVGPRSAGSSPGPACYGRGGMDATVTDADLVLGYLPVKNFADGRMDLDVEAACSAIQRNVGDPLGLDTIEAAWAIRRVVDATMSDAVRRVLAGRGADARDLSLVAYGGNGPVHAWSQALELDIARVILPRTAPVFSALGLLVADFRIEEIRAYITSMSNIDVNKVRELFNEMATKATKDLEPADLTPDQVSMHWFANMCYPGQNFDLSVPIDEGLKIDTLDLANIVERFHQLHEQDRGFCFRNHDPLLRSLRLVTVGASTTSPNLAPRNDSVGIASTGKRLAYFENGFEETPVYAGPLLEAGSRIDGPALIEEPFTVVVVPPGCSAVLDKEGHFELSELSALDALSSGRVMGASRAPNAD